MDKGELKVVSYKRVEFGFKAVVECSLDDKEPFKDEVALWKAKDRERYANGYVASRNGSLSDDNKKELRKEIEAGLRKKEEELKNEAEKQKAISVVASDNGKRKEMSEEERKEALELLQDPELLVRVQDDLTKMGIVDEEKNKTLLYLIATSRKMPQGLAATVKASSSSGKNHLVNTVASLMPQEDVKQFTRMSAKALVYAGEDSLKNKLIICTEVVGKEEAEYLVRAFLSEGELTSLTTVRDFEGGPFRTQESKVQGPIAYIETTTSYRIHPENATRVFEVYLNETEEQTEAINEQQATEASPKRFAIRQERGRIRQVHQNAQRLLSNDLNVVIPYAELIKFPPEDVRARRDFPKLLNLIAGVAFLHQYQRTIKKWEDCKEYIEASLLDYELAYRIAKDTFVETLDDLDKRSRDVLEVVRRELEGKAKETGKKIEDLEFDRDQVATWCGKPKHKLILQFKELEKKEYFIVRTDEVTHKRTYQLNMRLINRRSTFEGLTTPEELKQNWEEVAEEAVEPDNGNGKAEEVGIEPLPAIPVIPVIPLSHPLEEKK